MGEDKLTKRLWMVGASVHSDKTRVVEAASHQIKVCLTTLQLQLQMLARGAKRSQTLTSNEVTARVESCFQQTQALSEIAESMEDLVRVLHASLAADVRRSAADLSGLVSSVCTMYAKPARDQGCDLNLEQPGAVWAEFDCPRVKRCLSALIRNALSHGRGGPVKITLTTDKNRAYIEVRDHGPGISDADLARLKRSPSPPEPASGGTGIGLWLSAHLAAAMGGDLNGRRREGGGSSFLMWLPLGNETPSQGAGP